jgi:mitotic spindle assembly checkpoint protein MAD2B
MSTSTTLPTFAAIISAFTDFLTVAIHTILYERSIYPRTSFLSAKKYNYPVRQNRHPKVCEWISDAVAAVEEELLKGTVSRVVVVIFSPQNKPLERFVFDLSKFPVVSREEMHTPIERPASSVSKRPNVDLDEQFRAVMAKLSTSGSSLKPLPPECSFTVAIELKDVADPPIGHPQPWIPVEPGLQRNVVEKDGIRTQTGMGCDLGGVRTTPVRAVDTNDIAFEMWIEEEAAKIGDPSTEE